MLKGRSPDQARVDEGPLYPLLPQHGRPRRAYYERSYTRNEGNPFGPPLVFAVIAHALDRLGSNLKTP